MTDGGGGNWGLRILLVLDEDAWSSRSGSVSAHGLCLSVATCHFHAGMEARLHLSRLTAVFTPAQHPPLASWMCRMSSAHSESLWYRTQQGSDSITLNKQTANMRPACYRFSLIVLSQPLKVPPPNDKGAPLSSHVSDSVSCSPLWNWGKEDEFIHICSSGVTFNKPITGLQARGAKLLSGSNKAHVGSSEDQIWQDRWHTLSC